MREFLPCLYAFLACLAFAGIFEVKKPRILLLSSLTGAAGWAVYILAAPLGDVVLRSLVATLVLALLSEVLSRVLKAPATIFLIVGIIPLVPGGGLYYTMYYLVNSDLDLFLREADGRIKSRMDDVPSIRRQRSELTPEGKRMSSGDLDVPAPEADGPENGK